VELEPSDTEKLTHGSGLHSALRGSTRPVTRAGALPKIVQADGRAIAPPRAARAQRSSS
jgi:hypothetical protein